MSLVSSPFKVAFIIANVLVSGLALGALKPISDNELGDVVAQSGGLFISDHIAPNELTGAPGDGSANFDFYRMGLDVKMDMNLNMAKFQLGCGGGQ